MEEGKRERVREKEEWEEVKRPSKRRKVEGKGKGVPGRDDRLDLDFECPPRGIVPY